MIEKQIQSDKCVAVMLIASPISMLYKMKIVGQRSGSLEVIEAFSSIFLSIYSCCSFNNF